MKKHAIVLPLLIVVVSAILVVFILNLGLAPLSAATQSPPIDSLLYLLLSIAAVIFALCLVTLIYSAIVFRARPGDVEDGPPIHGHNLLEAIWTLIPLAIVLILAVYGAVVLQDITRATAGGQELEVKVIASQWAWRFEYPQYGIATSELRLPVNRPVLFKLTSQDVIHSFWVPEFRVKMDNVPGMETVLRVTPNRLGQYKLLCAELCGLAHTYMTAPVNVTGEDEFNRWAQGQRP